MINKIYVSKENLNWFSYKTLELQKKIENDYNIPTYFLPFGFEIENEVD